MVRRKHKFGSPYLTNQTKPTNDMEQSPSWETNGCSASKKSPALYVTRKISTAFIPARHPSLFWASLIQFMPPFHFLRSTLILSSHLHLGLRSGLFPLSFLTKSEHAPILYPIRPTWAANLIFLDHSIFGEEYRSSSSSLCSFLHSSVTSSLLGPNTLLSTLFSNILSLRSSFIVSDQVSHPYKTTDRIIASIIRQRKI